MSASKKKPDSYMIDEENPEWTEEMFANARPASEVLYEIFSQEVAEEMLKPKVGRPLGSGVKKAQTISLDVSIIVSFKATGKGWQTRINAALQTYLEEHPLKHA